MNKYSDTLHKIEDPLLICELQSALNEDQCAQREFFSRHQFVCVLDKFDKDLLHIDVCTEIGVVLFFHCCIHFISSSAKKYE